MLISVSDTHMGERNSKVEEFKEFLDYVGNRDDIMYLVLCGDIFEFATVNNWETFKISKEVIEKFRNIDCNVHYVVGNHDILFNIDDELHSLSEPNVSIEQHTERSPFSLKINGQRFIFKHGYSLDVYTTKTLSTNLRNYENFWKSIQWTDTFFGTIKRRIWNVYRRVENFFGRTNERVKDLAESPIREEICGVENDSILVFGHTHEEYVGDKSVNCGSWVDDFLHESKSAYVEIDNKANYDVKYW